MKIKSLKQKKKWQGQRVLLRVDFNVPSTKGRIDEDYRIEAALPTIKYLQAKGAKLIIITHWGRPEKATPMWSVRILAKRLHKLLKKPVKFIPEIAGQKVTKAIEALKDGEIIFLENLRFYPDEKKNGAIFAKELATLADVYVNEAFSVSHRAQASVSAITRYLPAFAGLQLEAEIRNLQKILKPKKPLVVVMGGAKVMTKAPIIKELYARSSQIIIGGILANTIWHYQGIEIGKSVYDKSADKLIAPFFKYKKILPKLILPIDVIVKTAKGQSLCKSLEQVKKSDCILDVGPDSIALFSTYIKKSQTIVWNGPLGKFEEVAYKHGTLAIGTIIAARSAGRAFGLVGGGETIEALEMTRMTEGIDQMSTAGGAMLAYLGGAKMPGLKNIIS